MTSYTDRPTIVPLGASCLVTGQISARRDSDTASEHNTFARPSSPMTPVLQSTS
jgi:hypothetical protein